MGDDTLKVQFVWVDADWPEAGPMSNNSAVSRAAFHVDEADKRQPTLSVADRLLPAGSVVQQAFATHLNQQARERLSSGLMSAAVYGRRARANQPLYDGDRIELLGPVSADPKGERRARVQQARQVSTRDKWNTES